MMLLFADALSILMRRLRGLRIVLSVERVDALLRIETYIKDKEK
jgi:hypothetical protein